ncbi:uncharacterized protein [Zea mays]|uniref:uncharacterized protein isoform X1 n=1 Tax=Zea mays TaxID=4577 RepID=UPI0009AA7E83|nr:uncharacterized protein LOC103641878 isoform X1 [Zea mays]XP_020401622.1 uncharacterized protein LOC103641878 isoform X1 [Zea mays]XP_020401623.1 uncharacterized protein LOC103641878 isoform X1 [Zea mays]XP_020401625.1 uncharacterized protein LOC103641878 isoform X1 [Zea mays]XP_020401626.1 uncharacterized protein LOC103641878 isoform X1 [Zea mays]XP_020401627.1 uncharacterized protein LOC103641878 isoform X1 [Zea mays]XP_020401628.1 uncharacterized protein LOC103641878 isoform X1 [Zea may|eukprot:XP_020401621.1 uncharacterized protein LOC103641878 isoform X1 [Zea mays]
MMERGCSVMLVFGAGSEIYQETLVKALAKHFGARLLVLDSLLLPWRGRIRTQRKEVKRGESTKVHQSQVPAHLQNLQAATMRVGVQGSPDHSRDQREQGRKRRVGQGPSTEAVKARRKAWYASLNSSGSKE